MMRAVLSLINLAVIFLITSLYLNFIFKNAATSAPWKRKVHYGSTGCCDLLNFIYPILT